jgi:hypothetical protein
MSDKSEVNRFIRSNDSVKSLVDATGVNVRRITSNILNSPKESKDLDSKKNNDAIDSTNLNSSGAPQSFADLCANTSLNN